MKNSWFESFWNEKSFRVGVHFFGKKRPGPTYVGPGPQVWSADQKKNSWKTQLDSSHLEKKICRKIPIFLTKIAVGKVGPPLFFHQNGVACPYSFSSPWKYVEKVFTVIAVGSLWCFIIFQNMNILITADITFLLFDHSFTEINRWPACLSLKLQLLHRAASHGMQYRSASFCNIIIVYN